MGRETVRSIVVAFVASRALILLLLVLGSQIAFLSHDYGGKIWRTEITFSPGRLAPELTRVVMVADGWWYREIALHGYEERRDDQARSTWAFFPLFPLATRVLAPLLGFTASALLLSNACFAGALFALALVCIRLGVSTEDVQRMIWCICLFPTSYFFSLPVTESLFLLLSSLAFLSAVEERWWVAGLLGALAALTRVVGVILLVPLLLLPWQRRGRMSRSQMWLLLIPAALAAFALFLHERTGDPLAFIHAQRLWGRTGIAALASGVQPANGIIVSRPWNFILLNGSIAVVMLISAVAMLRAKEWSYGSYTLLLVALPLLSGSVQSIDRYALVAFPMFLWLARNARAASSERALLAMFTVLLGWLVALFTLRVDFALA